MKPAIKVALSAGIASGILCCTLGTSWCGQASNPTNPKDPPVECSWTCHCAKQLDDCESTESRWDLCIDTKRSVHPDKVENCDKCKEVAKAACAERRCTPDPQKGQKYIFQYFCDGREQPLVSSAVPRSVDDALLVSPSVGLPIAVESGESLLRQPGRSSQRRTEPQKDPRDPPTPANTAVTCRYRCGCSADTGMCDEHEKRSQMCVDKDDKDLTSDLACWQCEAKARVACWKQKCPLAGATTKVMTSFECPVR